MADPLRPFVRLASHLAMVFATAAVGAAQGLAPGAVVHVTRADGTAYDGRFVAVTPERPFIVMTRDGQARTLPLASIVSVTLTDEVASIKPAWSTETRTTPIYEFLLTGGEKLAAGMVQWATFDLDRDGKVERNQWALALRSLAVAPAPPAARGAVPAGDFGFDAPTHPAGAGAVGTGPWPVAIVVLDAGRGTPEPGAIVQLTDRDRSFLDLTGADGLVSFVVPTPGRWRVRVRTTGHGDEVAEFMVPAADAAGGTSRIALEVRHP